MDTFSMIYRSYIPWHVGDELKVQMVKVVTGSLAMLLICTAVPVLADQTFDGQAEMRKPLAELQANERAAEAALRAQNARQEASFRASLAKNPIHGGYRGDDATPHRSSNTPHTATVAK
jgi:hypothetical protein